MIKKPSQFRSAILIRVFSGLLVVSLVVDAPSALSAQSLFTEWIPMAPTMTQGLFSRTALANASACSIQSRSVAKREITTSTLYGPRPLQRFSPPPDSGTPRSPRQSFPRKKRDAQKELARQIHVVYSVSEELSREIAQAVFHRFKSISRDPEDLEMDIDLLKQSLSPALRAFSPDRKAKLQFVLERLLSGDPLFSDFYHGSRSTPAIRGLLQSSGGFLSSEKMEKQKIFPMVGELKAFFDHPDRKKVFLENSILKAFGFGTRAVKSKGEIQAEIVEMRESMKIMTHLRRGRIAMLRRYWRAVTQMGADRMKEIQASPKFVAGVGHGLLKKAGVVSRRTEDGRKVPDLIPFSAVNHFYVQEGDNAADIRAIRQWADDNGWTHISIFSFEELAALLPFMEAMPYELGGRGGETESIWAGLRIPHFQEAMRGIDEAGRIIKAKDNAALLKLAWLIVRDGVATPPGGAPEPEEERGTQAGSALSWINLVAAVPVVLAAILSSSWRAAQSDNSFFANLPGWSYVAVIALTALVQALIKHEGGHFIEAWWNGHKPRVIRTYGQMRGIPIGGISIAYSRPYAGIFTSTVGILLEVVMFNQHLIGWPMVIACVVADLFAAASLYDWAHWREYIWDEQAVKDYWATLRPTLHEVINMLRDLQSNRIGYAIKLEQLKKRHPEVSDLVSHLKFQEKLGEYTEDLVPKDPQSIYGRLAELRRSALTAVETVKADNAAPLGQQLMAQTRVIQKEMQNFSVLIREIADKVERSDPGDAEMIRLDMNMAMALIDQFCRTPDRFNALGQPRRINATRYAEMTALYFNAPGVSKNIRVTHSGDASGKTPMIRMDPNRFFETLYILFKNADEAAVEPQTTVHTQIKVDGNDIQLEVQDEGPGMAEETIRRVFEESFTTKAGKTIHGVGLPLLFQIVKAVGGSVNVQSRVQGGLLYEKSERLGRFTVSQVDDSSFPAFGTRFVIRLPAAPPSILPRTGSWRRNWVPVGVQQWFRQHFQFRLKQLWPAARQLARYA